MSKLANFINIFRTTNALDLDLVSSTHGTPGFQTPDGIVIARF